MKKKIFGFLAILMVCFSAVGLLAGCGAPVEKTFYCDEGLTITLDDSFSETQTTMTYTLQNRNVVFMAQKDTFDVIAEAGYSHIDTVQEYAQFCATNGGLSVMIGTNTDYQYAYFDYTNTAAGQLYHYYAVVVKGSDAFWLCQFACFDSKINTYSETFDMWAQTIIVA